MKSKSPVPRLSFSAMCEFLKASHTRQLSLLREQAYPEEGPIRSYQAARNVVRDFAVNGTPLTIDDLRPHEAEVIALLQQNQWALPAASASLPATTRREMSLNGVEIKAYPDLLLHDNLGRGALKLYFAKAELSPDVGQQMANLLYYFQHEIAGDDSANANLCIVHDVRGDVEYRASKNYKRMIRNIESACEFIRVIWPTL
jgi:hypothetical protein